ncbi:Lrp/AsnC family transcriptional regulator [Capillimicrobium parvum]|uniref:Leucine-responsive regulatory protein n=1 Tax=Capillimicrobium parvum TaxID=2884022 RepID=A0A9E6XU98_9ACTN|nr:Lrp/AsnC family transcriptional regulator [Capillimicrobium parvum]UGS33876.1 Leucine-responsive regulatory protein [Capillimicrobium parvum]
MAAPELLDQIDHAILELLREDARRTVTDIAGRVNLSLAPVKRRIERLERTGVIRGYTVVLDPSKVTAALEAYTEVCVGPGALEDVMDFVQCVPEVQEVSVIAGDPDLLLLLRAENVGDLHRVINQIRRDSRISSTKTLVTLKTWVRSQSQDYEAPSHLVEGSASPAA